MVGRSKGRQEKTVGGGREEGLRKSKGRHQREGTVGGGREEGLREDGWTQ